jgi:hypothetical protein
MKATGKFVPVCMLAATCLAVCLALEGRAWLKLDSENDALRRQLSKMGEVALENRRLSNILAHASASTLPGGGSDASAAMDEQAKELARLRSEMEALLQHSNEVENLRADTRATRAALKDARKAQMASCANNQASSGAANDGQFQILEARYGTDRTNMDVVSELNDRIRGNSLKMMANNKLTGDLDFGQVKHLTVVYSFGGVVMTNEFREGDVVVLPEDTQ